MTAFPVATSPFHLTTAGTYILQGAPGTTLYTVNVNTGAASSSMTIYDNTAASGTVVSVVSTVSPVSLSFGYNLTKGCTVVISGGNPDVLITFGAPPVGEQIILPVPVSQGGTGSTVKNYVDLTSAQTITGAKTFAGAAAANNVILADVTGDTASRYTLGADGKQQWGDGTNPVDVNLYRYAADGLATDAVLKLNTAATLLLGSAGDTSIARAAAGVANFSNPGAAHSATLAIDGNALIGTTTALGDNGAGEIQLAVASTVPTTNPTGGVVLYCNAGGHLVQRNVTGMTPFVGGNLSQTTSTTTIASTAALSALQSVTINAGDPAQGSVYRMYGYGVYSVTGTPTLTFGLYWGGIAGTLLTSIPAITASSGITNAPFRYTVVVNFRSTTSCVAAIDLHFVTSTTTNASTGYVAVPSAPVTVTTNTNSNLTVGFTWGTSDPLNTISLLGGNAELVR